MNSVNINRTDEECLKNVLEYTEDNLNDMSLKMLRKIGKEKKLKGFSYVNKNELILMILQNKSWLQILNEKDSKKKKENIKRIYKKKI
jgi:hypothetical protein